MKPVDYRNDTWESIQERISGDRKAVFYALRRFGPSTTRRLAEAMEWDILNVRPRVTELCQLGLVVTHDPGHRTPEGLYRAKGDHEAMADFERIKRDTLNPTQLDLKIS
jgi:hypothetical protein